MNGGGRKGKIPQADECGGELTQHSSGAGEIPSKTHEESKVVHIRHHFRVAQLPVFTPALMLVLL